MVTKSIWKKIKEYDTITIFRHIFPDGDAIGSQIGLKRMINKMFPKKKVYCLGSQSSYWGQIFDAMDEEVPLEVIKDSLAIVLDVATKNRVDDERFIEAKEILKIDHHIYVETLGHNIDWVDTSFCACCEMITKIAVDNKVKLDENIALPLYAGMVTDSGRFLYSSTSFRTFELANKLVATGIDFVNLYSFIYAQDIESVKFKGYCQSSFKLTEHGVGYNIITKEIQEQFGVTTNSGAGIVNVLSNIKGVPIWVHFASKEDGTVKVEMRSSGAPVNEVAAKYGGGGHKQAAGCVIESLDVVENVLHDLDELAKGV